MDKTEVLKQPVIISFNKNNASVSSFISYLITALDSRGIKLFFGLKLFLVVFSSDYANSVSCLENLVKFVELSRHDKNSYVVIPIFYGVSRLAVKQQLGTFRDAFAELEVSYSADQVNKWQCALMETAELQGHEYNSELSDESEFLEEIAEDVFERLYPTEEIGIHKRQLDIENLLCKQPWGVRTLGIFGESGIGKTILTRAVHRRMYSGYDDSCFIEDFHSRYNEMTLESLPGKFLCMTSVVKFDLNHSVLEACNRQKRLLVALDDVQNAKDMESFLGTVNQFGPGSLIIITSRDKRVLEECHVNEIYELKGLNDEDALKLFARSVFGNEAIEKNLLDLSMRVIECSDGNPSTLISYANKLKGKKTTKMEPALLKICHDAFMNTMKNTCFITNGNEDEHGVLDTRDIKSTNWKQSIHGATQRFLAGLEMLSDCLLSDLRVSHLETLVKLEELLEARGLDQLDLQHCPSMESLPVNHQLKSLKFLNLRGCIEIKDFPEVTPTISELDLEGQILQWGLQTDHLCLLCNSANETRSHLYFDCTFSWSIWTTISNRIHLSPLRIWEDVHSAMVNLTGSKAKKILSRMACKLTIYGLWVERNRRLYKKSYRSADSILAQIDVMIRNKASSLRKSKPKIASEILQLWLETSSSP